MTAWRAPAAARRKAPFCRDDRRRSSRRSLRRRSPPSQRREGSRAHRLEGGECLLVAGEVFGRVFREIEIHLRVYLRYHAPHRLAQQGGGGHCGEAIAELIGN